ncbi:Ubiquitin domain-containing protein UBFD1 [Halotydeus destructor]|nr:Ubiquitin domain-containing protein UBFD1 [Halotydeus destructor]
MVINMTTDDEASSKSCATDANSDDAKHCSSIATENKGDNLKNLSQSDVSQLPDEKDSNENVPSNKETIDFKVIYNKEKYDVTFPVDDTVSCLKQHIEKLTRVPAAMQKLLYKGMAKDDNTLRECSLPVGAKIMVMGSTLTDVLSVSKPQNVEVAASSITTEGLTEKESMSQQKIHKKIIDRGVPADAMPAWRNGKTPLPPEPLSGMVNKSGGKVRLTFKLEADQLWIGTKERTEKVSMQSIRAIVSEPIEGHEEYHLMAIQLGPTEASRYWVYWVPAQYVDAIKDMVLG